MTHPDRQRYGGLDPAPPDDKETGAARFEANFAADFGADFGMDTRADTSAGYEADYEAGYEAGYEADYEADMSAGFGEDTGTAPFADNSVDFPADPTGPTAAGFKRRG